ncbi:MAG TPA: hypothetical protein VNH53_09120 [Sphingomicrobium sp.]|nr:hypothetical protein [Sphingomicrobium sp.]
MTAEWWVREAFSRAGYSKLEARCTAKAFTAAMPQEALWQVRSDLMAADRPERFAGVEELFAWLGPRVDAETLRVLRHYANACEGR